MLVLGLVCVLTMWLILRWKKRKLFRVSKQLKSNKMALPFIGHSYLFLGNQEGMMDQLKYFGREAIERGGLSSMWHGSKLFIVAADAVAAEIILKNCLEKDDMMTFASVFLGEGSIIAPVSIWRPRRKALAPTFSVKNLIRFVDTFAKQSSIMVEQIKTAADSGPFSVWKYFATYNMDSVCESTLGIQMEAQKYPSHPFFIVFRDFFGMTAHLALKPWLQYHFILTKLKMYKTVQKHKLLIFDFIDKIIKEKRQEKPNNTEGFRTLVENLCQTSNGLTDVSIREECVVVLFAATDTTAVAAGFTTVMLAQRQDVQDRVIEELKEVFGESTRPVNVDDLNRLKYLEAVIKETLRFYPPVPIIVRKIQEDLLLPSGLTLPSGCSVMINIWAVHRNPEYWGEDADLFRPERFLESSPIHQAAFMPFSSGPRACLGYKYAMMSVKTALATLLRQCRVAPSTEQTQGELRVKFDTIMRHVDNYNVKIYPRARINPDQDKTSK